MRSDPATVAPHVILTAQRSTEGPGPLWLYAGYLGQVIGEPAAGDVIDVLTAKGRFYGRGFFNPYSKIRVRMLTFDQEPIDKLFWQHRLRHACDLRHRVVTHTNAYRVIFGEGDRLPGLIVDRYDRTLVMQTLSYGMDRRKDLLADLLIKETNASAVFLRNDAKSRQLEGLPLERGFLRGSGPTRVEVREGPARFMVDIECGQKTGWFCDQRENRLAAAKYTVGGEVLEVFCHTGAFGVHAALAGATMVEGLDVSEEALAMAREHAVLNQVQGRCVYRKADAFEEMRRLVKTGKRYDVVMLDPPAFARSKRALPGALGGYKDINLLGIKLVKPQGFIITSSCSHPVSAGEFFTSIRLAAHDAKREMRLIEQCGQSPDHPVLSSTPETRYLKCFIFQVF